MTEVNIGKGLVLDVDLSKFTPEVMAHVVYIGVRNILMDSHAGHTPEKDGDNFVANSRATAERKLAAMYAGEVRVGGQREGDPIRAEAVKLASNMIKAQYRKLGKKLSSIDAKDLRAAALKLIDKNPSILATAKANVETARELDVDMSGII